MKKVISLGLIVIVVLSMGPMAFADEIETTFQRGFGRGMSKDFERGTRMNVNEERFENCENEEQVNLDLNFKGTEPVVELLLELTGDSVEVIEASGLTLHTYAEDNNVLKAFQKELLEVKKEKINELVEDEVITQEKADFMLERMSQMNGTQLGQQEKQRGGNGFNRQGKGRRFN